MKFLGRSLKPLLPLQEFIDKEASSGIFLLITTAIALILANSPLSESYFNFFQIHLSVSISNFSINKPLLLWINDGLMTIFFLLIGLEIKRELKYGELSDFRSAFLPFIAALGGAIVPGAIFFTLNMGTVFQGGWAIAIATDIAFAIGILALLGSKVPLWAKVFLTAVAVVDDLLAVLVIAIFYTSTIKAVPLFIAGGCVLILLIMNYMNVWQLGLYLLIGLFLWIAVLKSGIHATIAGVLLGLVIPASRRNSLDSILNKAKKSIILLQHAFQKDQDETRETALNYMEEVVAESESPLHRLEHLLHPWVAYGIMPIFALANAGVAINSSLISQAFSSTLTWGIMLGLFVGKQVGIFSAVLLMKSLNLSGLPAEKGTLKIIYGLACLGGIGFTMSIFIAGLSFSIPEYLEFSKIGIIAGSLFSGSSGYFLLKKA